MVLSNPIMLLLYPAQQASAVNAAESLFILAFGAIFLSLVQTLTGILPVSYTHLAGLSFQADPM